MTLSNASAPATNAPVWSGASVHNDTAEALAVSSSLIGKATGSYGRERHLLLTPSSAWSAAGGTGIDPLATPRAAFRTADADFTVESRPLAMDINAGTPADSSCDWRCVNSHKAVVRTDTNAALGVVGRNYHPIQNESLISLFEYLREDAQIENIICLNGGAKVVVSASLNITAAVKDGDQISRYIHAFNGHDGGTAFGVFFSDLRLVCANQLRYITGKGSKLAAASESGLRARHTSGGATLAQRLPQLIDLEQQKFHREIQELRPLTTCKLSSEFAQHILSATFADKLAVPISVSRGSDEKRERTLADLPEIDVIRGHYGRGTGIGIEVGDRSVWNMFQAVTQWATHDAGRSQDPNVAARQRLEALWGGSLSQRIDRCRAACLEVVAA